MNRTRTALTNPADRIDTARGTDRKSPSPDIRRNVRNVHRLPFAPVPGHRHTLDRRIDLAEVVHAFVQLQLPACPEEGRQCHNQPKKDDEGCRNKDQKYSASSFHTCHSDDRVQFNVPHFTLPGVTCHGFSTCASLAVGTVGGGSRGPCFAERFAGHAARPPWMN